jgi:hypothetical protein
VTSDSKAPDPHRPEERRRSSRFPLVLPVTVKWQASSNEFLQAEAEAKEGNNHGGLLEMKIHPPMGCEVELTNPISSEVTRARVVAVRRAKQGLAHEIGVEFFVPNAVFWGMGFRLKKAATELRELDEALKTGGVDSRVLREFRDAVDYVRKTAWAVQEWQERQLQHRDTATVLPLLTAERVRRATQLSNAVVSDLKTHEATAETPGIEDLFRSVEHLRDHLAGVFKRSPTS